MFGLICIHTMTMQLTVNKRKSSHIHLPLHKNYFQVAPVRRCLAKHTMYETQVTVKEANILTVSWLGYQFIQM